MIGTLRWCDRLRGAHPLFRHFNIELTRVTILSTSRASEKMSFWCVLQRQTWRRWRQQEEKRVSVSFPRLMGHHFSGLDGEGVLAVSSEADGADSGSTAMRIFVSGLEMGMATETGV